MGPPLRPQPLDHPVGLGTSLGRHDRLDFVKDGPLLPKDCLAGLAEGILEGLEMGFHEAEHGTVTHAQDLPGAVILALAGSEVRRIASHVPG
jgi:hypothetical protein